MSYRIWDTHSEGKVIQFFPDGTPHVSLTAENIGGSKAIFGICLGGIVASKMGEEPQSTDANLWMLDFHDSILEHSHHACSTIKPGPGMVVIPDTIDRSSGYLIHVYGNIVFRDMLFEDVWFRNFHYSRPVLPPNARRYYAMTIWQPYIEEVDIRRNPPKGWRKAIKVWRAYMAWIEKQETK